MKKEILIIGGGAAGMMTAISAALHQKEKVTLLDSSAKPGQKILMSGGGRCNITNAKLEFSNYFGESPNAIKKVILQFPPEKVIEFFNTEGLQTKIEKPWNKYFPATDQAESVLQVLTKKLKQLNVELIYPEKVEDFFQENELWVIKTDRQHYTTKKLILAFGGFSYPHTGSDGLLWKVLDRLHIEIKKPRPALTPLKTADSFTHQISGVTHWVKIKVIQNNKLIFSEENSVLFTHDGLSGPGILNASQWFTHSKMTDEFILEFSFLPDETEELFDLKILTFSQNYPNTKIEKFLSQFIPNRLAEVITTQTKTSGKTLNQLTKTERKETLKFLFHFRPSVSGHAGYKKAEVTAGGIPFSELDLKSMQLKKFPNLYAVGEVVNVHGIIGGYNFQWAWSSGWVCGKNL